MQRFWMSRLLGRKGGLHSAFQFYQQLDFIIFAVGGRNDLCSSDSGCCTCFILSDTAGTKSECCPRKIVEGVEYVLLERSDEIGKEFKCLDGCIYKDKMGKRFCFKSGGAEAKCGL